MPKKNKRTDTEASNIRKIYAHSDLVEMTAQRLYDLGQGASVTKVYHEIKDQLKLPGNYEFALGDAIKDILREAGWIQGR